MTKKIYRWKDDDFIPKLILSLKKNLISVTSTDTILGFLGNTTQKSFDKITKIKGQREDKPFLILVSSYEKIFKFVDANKLNKNLANLLKKSWPGPLTVIFNTQENVPEYLKSKTNTIAIRCPKHYGLQKILPHFDGLFSTSANKTGEPFPTTISELNPEVIKQVEYIVNDSTETLTKIDTTDKFNQTLPSTIIDTSIIRKEVTIKVLRKGAYPIEELEEYYGKKFI